jgi:hypothetical protein
MKKRPLIFNFYTLFFLCVSISFPIQIMSLYGHAPGEASMILNKMSYLNWAVVAACGLNALFSFNGHWLLKFSLPISFFTVALNNFYVSKLAHDFSPMATTFATLAFGLTSTYLFFTEEKSLLDDQNKRWWLAPERFQRNFPVWVQGPLGSPLLSKTFDISSSGAFLSHPALAKMNEGMTKPINEGDRISLTLGLSGQKEFSCDAEVVRLCQPNGNYPGGIGIKFEDLSMSNKWILDQILKDTAIIASA